MLASSMTTHYNQIAGQSVERLAALSDGIFAVAMTLLVLDLRVPAAEAVHSERDLWRALLTLSPQLVMYMMSFLTLGIFWIGQQTQLNHLARSTRGLAWMHLLFLFAVTLTPFSTRLLAEHTAYRSALLLDWLNICFSASRSTSPGHAPSACVCGKTICRQKFPASANAASSSANLSTPSAPPSAFSARAGASPSF
jgi:Endosomal/lysosomal potassium channel TMEM175